MRAEEGNGTFFRGLKPLWMRQIPYTMMKFACFEKTVEAIYKYIVPKPRDQCSKTEQLMVTFGAGYIAGVFCAIVSHPADSVVSVINKDPSKGAGQSKFYCFKLLDYKVLFQNLNISLKIYFFIKEVLPS